MRDDREAGDAEVSSANHVESVEVYETGGATVLYDSRNPLAWIESSVALAVDDAT